jgi:hypothetical protein
LHLLLLALGLLANKISDSKDLSESTASTKSGGENNG